MHTIFGQWIFKHFHISTTGCSVWAQFHADCVQHFIKYRGNASHSVFVSLEKFSAINLVDLWLHDATLKSCLTYQMVRRSLFVYVDVPSVDTVNVKKLQSQLG